MSCPDTYCFGYYVVIRFFRENVCLMTALRPILTWLSGKLAIIEKSVYGFSRELLKVSRKSGGVSFESGNCYTRCMLVTVNKE